MAKNGFSMSNRIAVEEITATKTLTVNDCGKHFSVDTAAVTMPQQTVFCPQRLVTKSKSTVTVQTGMLTDPLTADLTQSLLNTEN